MEMDGEMLRIDRLPVQFAVIPCGEATGREDQYKYQECRFQDALAVKPHKTFLHLN